MDSQLRKIERLRNSVVPKKKEQQQAEIFFWKQYIWIDLIFNSILLLLILYISVLYIINIVLMKYSIFLKAFLFQSDFQQKMYPVRIS